MTVKCCGDKLKLTEKGGSKSAYLLNFYKGGDIPDNAQGLLSTWCQGTMPYQGSKLSLQCTFFFCGWWHSWKCSGLTFKQDLEYHMGSLGSNLGRTCAGQSPYLLYCLSWRDNPWSLVIFKTDIYICFLALKTKAAIALVCLCVPPSLPPGVWGWMGHCEPMQASWTEKKVTTRFPPRQAVYFHVPHFFVIARNRR